MNVTVFVDLEINREVEIEASSRQAAEEEALAQVLEELGLESTPDPDDQEYTVISLDSYESEGEDA